MKREVEVKFRIRECLRFEQRLRALGADYAGTVRERNTLYDAADRRLTRADRALRLRRSEAQGGPARSHAVLTYKGPRSGGPYKDREEREVEILDPDELHAILLALDLVPTLEFEKQRSTWKWNDAEIVIDSIEHLGHFLEIEASPERIEAAIDALGLRDPASGAALEPRSYPEMLAGEAGG